MITATDPTMKGLALVNDKDDFESFVMDFFIFDNAAFEKIEDWYSFFCGAENAGWLSGEEPDILQLIDELDVELTPKEFPAFILFDFEDFRPPYTMREEAIFESFTAQELDIRSIETKDNSYTIAHSD